MDTDSLKYYGLRKQMVEMLQDKGIKNAEVLKAMGIVPRHRFIHIGFEDHAYEEKAFPIGSGQTISNPYTVAVQTDLLAVSPDDKILEIGTGCGYQTAVLMEMKATVYSIERQKELYEKTNKLLPAMGYQNMNLIYGDGYKGLDVQAPFDSIIVTAGAPFVPAPLLKQLKIGGRLVIPVGDKEQIMTRFIRRSDKEFEKKEFGNFRFVPMLEDKE